MLGMEKAALVINFFLKFEVIIFNSVWHWNISSTEKNSLPACSNHMIMSIIKMVAFLYK